MVEVASQTLDRSNFKNAWIKVDIRDSGIILAIMEVESGRGTFRIGVRCFRIADIPKLTVVAKITIESSSNTIFVALLEVEHSADSRNRWNDIDEGSVWMLEEDGSWPKSSHILEIQSADSMHVSKIPHASKQNLNFDDPTLHVENNVDGKVCGPAVGIVAFQVQNFPSSYRR